MPKILFIDIDGTLVDYEGNLPESAIEAVRQARKNGHKVYLCSGRSKAEVYAPIWAIGVDGYLGGNGCYIESEGNVVFEQLIPEKTSHEIVDWLHDNHLEFFLESNSGLYASENFETAGLPVMRLYSQRKGAANADKLTVRDAFPEMIFDGDLYRNDLNKVSFILSDLSDLDKAKERFPDMKIGSWGGAGELALFGDVAAENIDKATAVRIVLEAEKADLADTIAFGDAKVDLPMFEACSYGVAMGSGGDEIRAASDLVTDDVDKDGLYKAFRTLNLILSFDLKQARPSTDLLFYRQPGRPALNWKAGQNKGESE